VSDVMVQSVIAIAARWHRHGGRIRREQRHRGAPAGAWVDYVQGFSVGKPRFDQHPRAVFCAAADTRRKVASL